MRRLKPNRASATYPVAVAGALHGLGRAGSYAAAAQNAFPTIRIAGCLLALATPINETLGLSGFDDARVQEAYRLCGFELPPLAGGKPKLKPPVAARAKRAAPKRKRKPKPKSTRKSETTAVVS